MFSVDAVKYSKNLWGIACQDFLQIVKRDAYGLEFDTLFIVLWSLWQVNKYGMEISLP